MLDALSLRATLLLTCSVLAVAVRATAQETETGAQKPATFAGTVRDHETKAPVPGATVSLVDGPGGTEGIGVRITDEYGHFRFDRVPSGLYTVEVGTLGYADYADTLRVEAETEVRMILDMAVSPLELEPLVVVTERGIPAFMDGFEERRARDRSQTFFVTRAEIEEQQPRFLSDILRHAPETYFARDSGDTYDLRVRRLDSPAGLGLGTQLGGQFGSTLLTCRPDLWWNGRHIQRPDAGSGLQSSGELGPTIDEMFGVEEIEAVELYPNSHEVVPEFPSYNGCGSLVVWTRPRDPELTPPLWRRWFMAVGALVGAIVLFR